MYTSFFLYFTYVIRNLCFSFYFFKQKLPKNILLRPVCCWFQKFSHWLENLLLTNCNDPKYPTLNVYCEKKITGAEIILVENHYNIEINNTTPERINGQSFLDSVVVVFVWGVNRYPIKTSNMVHFIFFNFN